MERARFPSEADVRYDPNLQQWVNRDPIGEVGFERVFRKRTEQRWLPIEARAPGEPEEINGYAFVRNNPGGNYDAEGLSCGSFAADCRCLAVAIVVCLPALEWPPGYVLCIALVKPLCCSTKNP